ncbi:MAG TPA: glycosyltransferase family 39 protein [Methylomirabilota bacterium]|nr:glycosyltransferase family 39 protein [Methylomirabilota bacterium]
MNAKVLIAVALVAAVLLLGNLGRAPFVDPPEGLHAEIAREMVTSGNWITPRLDGVPYFDKPPLLHWLIAVSYVALERSEWTARLGSALPAIGVAVLTARIGIVLGSARVGLLAGLMVAANLEVFVFGRLVKPDLLFVFSLLLALSAFIEAYLSGSRAALRLFFASLGLAALAKDVMGVIGPLALLVIFLSITRGRGGWPRGVPGGGLLLLLVAAPWYALVEWRNPGFLWYVIVDNHLLNFTRRRIFPDADVPLGALEFIGVTAAGFFPWVLALPWAVGRALGRAAITDQDRMWLLLGLWTVAVLGFFVVSPFRLPHYGLPAFPAMALLVARLWNEVLDGVRDGPALRRLLIPPLAVLAALAGLSVSMWRGGLALAAGLLPPVDVIARIMVAHGQQPSTLFLGQLQPLFGTLTLIFGLGAVGVAAGLWRRQAVIGLGAMLAAMMAFLPVSVEGFQIFARSRSVAPMAEMVAARAAAGDVFAHEGAIEDSATWLMSVDRPVQIVDGRRSVLAFGSTFPSARHRFWDRRDLTEAWRGERRVFLVSVIPPANSVVNDLPRDRVHLLLQAGDRWLYSNRP